VFAGAACRLAALYATREDVITIGEAVRFSWSSSQLRFYTCLPLGLILCGLIFWASTVALCLAGLGRHARRAHLVPAAPGRFILAGPAGRRAGRLAALVPRPSRWKARTSSMHSARSYSYIFHRPWRAAFYAIISIIYGAIASPSLSSSRC